MGSKCDFDRYIDRYRYVYPPIDKLIAGGSFQGLVYHFCYLLDMFMLQQEGCIEPVDEKIHQFLGAKTIFAIRPGLTVPGGHISKMTDWG